MAGKRPLVLNGWRVQQIQDGDFVDAPMVGCKLVQNAVTSIGRGLRVVIPWQVEQRKAGVTHSVTTNLHLVTLTTAGWYRLLGLVYITVNQAATVRVIRVRSAVQTTVFENTSAKPGAGTDGVGISIGSEEEFLAGDQVYVDAYNASQNLTTSGDVRTHFSLHKM